MESHQTTREEKQEKKIIKELQNSQEIINKMHCVHTINSYLKWTKLSNQKTQSG